jgi:hypothetical protein
MCTLRLITSVSISLYKSIETSYVFLSGPPEPLKYTLVGSKVMVGSGQSSTQMVRVRRFFRWAHITCGARNLNINQIVLFSEDTYKLLMVGTWFYILFTVTVCFPLSNRAPNAIYTYRWQIKRPKIALNNNKSVLRQLLLNLTFVILLSFAGLRTSTVHRRLLRYNANIIKTIRKILFYIS